MKTHLLVLATLLIPSLTLAPSTSQAKVDLSCSKNPIYCKIMQLNPKTNPEFAAKLSTYIAKYSKQFGTNWRHSVAIAMQESAFENKNRVGTVMTKNGKLVTGVTDVGVFQIHVRTIAAFGINAHRLERDVEYQTYWHTRILAEKVKTCAKNRRSMEVKSGTEWSCYHSFTVEKRQVYVADVSPYLSQILR